MMSIFITTLALTLPIHIFTQQTCPKEYLRFTPEHSFCKAPNPSCQFVVKGMISKEKSKEIVEIHNRLRNKIAVGDETLAGGLPSASDMLAFSWDNELAQIAQKWIEQCLFDHDCPECRATRKFAVGQNVGYTWDPCSGNCDSVEPNWEERINSFYNEVQYFERQLVDAVDYPGPHTTTHFTQIAWAKTYRIGCGYVAFKEVNFEMDGIKQLYVCNYGPKGNTQQQPLYIQGSPCAKCPINSCCGSSCKGKKQQKFPGLCFLSNEAPIYPPKPDLLYFCGFQKDDRNCEFDSEGDGKWDVVRNIGGNFLSVVVQSGRTAIARFRNAIKVKKNSCMNLYLKKGSDTFGGKDNSNFEIEIEHNGRKDLNTVWTYPWSDYITSSIIVDYEGDIKISLKMTVPADATAQFLEIKQIEITKEPCKWGK